MPRTAVSHPCRPVPTEPDAALSRDLVELGLRGGLSAVGIASADPFEVTRVDLVDRKRRGLHGGMQFTYRNPERSTDPRRILANARSLVVGAWSYREEEQGDAEGDGRGDQGAHGPTRPVGRVARYARSDHYASLRGALGPLADHLRRGGWRATVVCDDNALVDRAAAHRAGLGWFGKNALVLVPGLGSWFVLGTVVTDAPLQTPPLSVPAPHGKGCGSCSACMRGCPTGALVAPGVLDARRCLAWLVQAPGSFPEEHRIALGDRIYGCDECQRVCPINRIADRRNPPPPARTGTEPTVDLLELLWASDGALLDAHGRWYISGRDPRYLRRNALIALGNVGDGQDPETERTLDHWLGANDPMLVEHARWAARQLGREDLVAKS